MSNLLGTDIYILRLQEAIAELSLWKHVSSPVERPSGRRRGSFRYNFHQEEFLARGWHQAALRIFGGNGPFLVSFA